MFCLRTSHSFPPSQTGCKHCYCEARGFSPKNPFKMATILPGLEIGERYMKAQVSSIHKLYTVKKKKKKLHNCCQSMQSLQECCMGPSLSEQRKHSQTPFPQRYHIRTSLVGKFLIYAVIFLFFFFCSGTGKALISRCHWILQCTPKSVLFSRLACIHLPVNK